MLLAHAPGRIALEVGVEDRRAAGLALPVSALAQTLQRPVDPVEDGGGAGEFGLVALLHEGAG
jgi:hypothetical protein